MGGSQQIVSRVMVRDREARGYGSKTGNMVAGSEQTFAPFGNQSPFREEKPE